MAVFKKGCSRLQFKDEYVFSFRDDTQLFSGKMTRNHLFCCLANNVRKWAVLICRPGLWRLKAQLRAVSLFFFFNLNYQSSWHFVEKEKQSQAHTGVASAWQHFQLIPAVTWTSIRFLPKANANSVCMEIIYSESWVTFLSYSCYWYCNDLAAFHHFFLMSGSC